MFSGRYSAIWEIGCLNSKLRLKLRKVLQYHFVTLVLINFTSTELGLEDQLLAKIVNVEKPELEEKKQELIDNFNRYKIELLELENNLLERLANAPEDILSDVPSMEQLERYFDRDGVF